MELIPLLKPAAIIIVAAEVVVAAVIIIVIVPVIIVVAAVHIIAPAIVVIIIVISGRIGPSGTGIDLAEAGLKVFQLLVLTGTGYSGSTASKAMCTGSKERLILMFLAATARLLTNCCSPLPRTETSTPAIGPTQNSQFRKLYFPNWLPVMHMISRIGINTAS